MFRRCLSVFTPPTGALQGVRGRAPAGTVSGMLFILAVGFAGESATSQELRWKPRGAAPNTKGQVENIAEGQVVGAINAVAPHPTDADTLYVGAVGGGIWKTTNATADSGPSWRLLADDQKSLAIGALAFDPTDDRHKTVVAGTGGLSSFGFRGARVGLLRTTDGGDSWTALGGEDLKDHNVSGVAARGKVLVVSTDRGVLRSTDTGTSWTRISGQDESKLPAGPAFDLAGDPDHPDRLFTNGGRSGLYRSCNAGGEWSKVSNDGMDDVLSSAVNLKIAVGGRGASVYVAIVTGRQLAKVFRSGDGGDTWAPMDLPGTAAAGIHPGGQGSIHLSLAADPRDANIVYIGGDRQDRPVTGFPNSIGAMDFSGRLFRGDASRPTGKQWVHLTHSRSAGPAGGGTAGNTAPHADSRDMSIAADGSLIESDDGGVYRRTSPRDNTGDWFSLIGNIQASEYHSVAWDAVGGVVVAGAQDTGTSEELEKEKTPFRSIATADGGAVAVDDTSTRGLSVRYSSSQYLGGFCRRVFDDHNRFVRQFTLTPGEQGIVPQFYTPIALNTVDPTRLVVGGANGVFESLNQGDTFRLVGPGIVVNASGLDPIAYGASGNPNMLYVGMGDQVFVRVAARPAPLRASASYQGGTVMGIAIDPGRPETAFVAGPAGVFRTTDAGRTWTDLSAGLASLEAGVLRSVAYSTRVPGGMLVIGSDTGVFQATGPTFLSWRRLGTGLPRVPVYHLEYDATDKLLLAGTLGRGAWVLEMPAAASVALAAAAPTALAAAAAREDNPPVDQEDRAFALRDGVIADPKNKFLYVMAPRNRERPNGGIAAVKLDDGTEAWFQDKAQKPLEVSGDLVIGQAAPDVANAGVPAPAGGLRIVALRRADGKVAVSGTQELPPGIVPAIDETPRGESLAQFVARARPASGPSAIVTWQYREQRASGLPPEFEQGAAPGALDNAPRPASPGPDRFDARSGTFRINLTSGKTESLNVPAPPMFAAPSALAREEPDAIPEDHRISADGQAVMLYRSTGGAADRDRYTVTIRDRGTGRDLGSYKSRVALANFFVSAGRVFFETPPYSEAAANGLVRESRKIRAVDLGTGRQVWDYTIRETTYTGPYAP